MSEKKIKKPLTKDMWNVKKAEETDNKKEEDIEDSQKEKDNIEKENIIKEEQGKEESQKDRSHKIGIIIISLITGLIFISLLWGLRANGNLYETIEKYIDDKKYNEVNELIDNNYEKMGERNYGCIYEYALCLSEYENKNYNMVYMNIEYLENDFKESDFEYNSLKKKIENFITDFKNTAYYKERYKKEHAEESKRIEKLREEFEKNYERISEIPPFEYMYEKDIVNTMLGEPFNKTVSNDYAGDKICYEWIDEGHNVIFKAIVKNTYHLKIHRNMLL